MKGLIEVKGYVQSPLIKLNEQNYAALGQRSAQVSDDRLDRSWQIQRPNLSSSRVGPDVARDRTRQSASAHFTEFLIAESDKEARKR